LRFQGDVLRSLDDFLAPPGQSKIHRHLHLKDFYISPTTMTVQMDWSSQAKMKASPKNFEKHKFFQLNRKQKIYFDPQMNN